MLPAPRQRSLGLAQRQFQTQPATPRQQGQRTLHPGPHGVGPACRIVGAPATRQKASTPGQSAKSAPQSIVFRQVSPATPACQPRPHQSEADAQAGRVLGPHSGHTQAGRVLGPRSGHTQAGRVLGPQSGLGFAEVPPAPEDPSRSIRLRHPKTRPVQSASSRLRIRAPRRPRPQGAAPAADRPALNNVSEGGARAE